MTDFLTLLGSIALTAVCAVFTILLLLLGIWGIVEVWRSIQP